jgi:hypothetical protein
MYTEADMIKKVEDAIAKERERIRQEIMKIGGAVGFNPDVQKHLGSLLQKLTQP